MILNGKVAEVPVMGSSGIPVFSRLYVKWPKMALFFFAHMLM